MINLGYRVMKCPYCKIENKVNLEIDGTYTGPLWIFHCCDDPDTGGCGGRFSVEITLRMKLATHRIYGQKNKP